MICDLNSVYRKRTKEVRFYETESGAEFDERGFLIGLAGEDLSNDLRDKIMDLSPFLQAVWDSIQDNIRWQGNARELAKIEREAFLKKGYREKAPGVWERKGFEVKEVGDYPVNLGEGEKI